MKVRQDMQSELDGFVTKSQFVITFNAGIDGAVTLSIKAPPLENFVFEGGGVCGYVYTSAIAQMFETHEISRSKRVAGASAGAINALGIALGMDSNEFMSIIGQLDFTKLVEVPLTESLRMLNELRKKGYINEGEHLLAFLRQLVKDKITYYMKRYPNELADLALNPDFVTFKNLRDIGTRLELAGIKEFYVAVTEIDEDPTVAPKLVVLSTDNPECDNIEIALGVMASAAIPKFFKPVVIPGREGKTYIDGGCMCNFPMNLFEAAKYAPKDIFVYQGEANQNLCTFGFKVDTAKEMQELLFAANNDNLTARVKKHLQRLIAKLITKVDIYGLEKENDELVRQHYAHRVCQIDNQGISMVKFNLTEDDKRKLFASGRDHTKSWQDNYFRAPIVHNQAFSSFEMMCESIPLHYLEALRNDIITGMTGKREGEFSHAAHEPFFSPDRQPLSSAACAEAFSLLETVLARRKHEAGLQEILSSRKRGSGEFFQQAPHPLLSLFILTITPHLNKATPDSFKEILGIVARLLTGHPEQFEREKRYWTQENIHGEYLKVLLHSKNNIEPDMEQLEKNIEKVMAVVGKFRNIIEKDSIANKGLNK